MAYETHPHDEEAQSTDSDHSEQQQEEKDYPFLAQRDLKRALAGGATGMIVAFSVMFAVGQVSSAEAANLLRGSLPTARFLASAIMTASATILALMLTLISVGHNAESDIKDYHYHRVKQIALLDVVAFVIATIFLLLLIVPVEDSENIPSGLFDVIYYVMIGVSSILGGLLIAVMLVLYSTVRDFIDKVGMNGDGG